MLGDFLTRIKPLPRTHWVQCLEPWRCHEFRIVRALTERCVRIRVINFVKLLDPEVLSILLHVIQRHKLDLEPGDSELVPGPLDSVPTGTGVECGVLGRICWECLGRGLLPRHNPRDTRCTYRNGNLKHIHQPLAAVVHVSERTPLRPSTSHRPRSPIDDCGDFFDWCALSSRHI